jgi:DNA-binding response OmpR family regulator
VSAEAYRSVRLALGDPEPSFCKIVTAALFPLGLRDVSVCLEGGSVRLATAATVDVVVCDTSLPQLDFKSYVQDVRQGRLGANPFVMLIATVRDEAEAQAQGIAQSGVDEIMAKPINPMLIVRRINNLSRERKSFVMTPNYVGPSRRAERRNDGSDDNLVAVPNTLRAKIIEQKSGAAIAAIVQEGRSGLDKEKAVSGLRVLARMTRQLTTLQEKGAAIDDSRAVLFSLSRMAQQVAALHGAHDEPGAAVHVAPIADRMARLATRAQNAPAGPGKAEIGLLLQLSEAAFAAFAPRGGETNLDTAATVPEIVAVVDGYLAR